MRNHQNFNLPSKIHFIGIGGAGLGPLARICLDLGCSVSGSDRQNLTALTNSKLHGATIWIPHNAAKFSATAPDLVVFSTAIPPENEEWKAALERNIPLMHRSELLERLASAHSRQVVVAGTHGKTTTTSMLCWILQEYRVDASWCIGGQPMQLEPQKLATDALDIFVLEGDESDRSFLRSKPKLAVITSLDPDHLENYAGSFAQQVQSFSQFARSAERLLIHSSVADAHPELLDTSFLTYGTDEAADWRIDRDRKIVEPSGRIHHKPFINCGLPGAHNFLNALAAIAAAQELGDIPVEASVSALEKFTGVERRFQFIGRTPNNITIYDDYAHHPSEIVAALNCARGQLSGRGRLIVLFQPHLPTRIRDLWQEFCTCFGEADILLVSDMYQARGKSIPGIDSRSLVECIEHKDVAYIPGNLNAVMETVLQKAKPHDLILIIGAGDITTIRETLFKRLRLLNEVSS